MHPLHGYMADSLQHRGAVGVAFELSVMGIMAILHLTLKKKWFDMIASGEKTEEYREIKPYWEKRLKFGHNYDAVSFRNGYSKCAPHLMIECKGIFTGHGVLAWGALKEPVFIIKLGKILTHNTI